MTSLWPFDPLPLFGFDLIVADPPWHFDLYSAKRALALAVGAVETDVFGPLEYVARPRGDDATLAQIAASRGLRPRAVTP